VRSAGPPDLDLDGDGDDVVVVERITAAGAVIVGRTSVLEFGCS
jgi:Asp-tRNA(Asn)/Glu-tRNA(Gln) amidotransferase A subunit family amidase